MWLGIIFMLVWVAAVFVFTNHGMYESRPNDCPPHRWTLKENVLTCDKCRYQPSRSTPDEPRDQDYY